MFILPWFLNISKLINIGLDISFSKSITSDKVSNYYILDQLWLIYTFEVLNSELGEFNNSNIKQNEECVGFTVMFFSFLL